MYLPTTEKSCLREWVKVFKNGLRKIFEKQPFKKFGVVWSP